MKSDLLALFNDFHENAKPVRGLNASFITLIPKCASPVAIEEYRPISLIGGVYKVIAKTLPYRLAKVLGEVISWNQSAFLASRNILDGIVVANEVVDEARKKKKKMFMFKIDFAKAYDSVSWYFLLDMLKILGFGERWCRWIKECISTAESSLLINGSPTKSFKFGRGLRQGDPLSPFLYLVIAEGLSRLMEMACASGGFSPVR